MASLARLTIIKKNGSLGGVCPMDTKELIIGRRAPLQHSCCSEWPWFMSS